MSTNQCLWRDAMKEKEFLGTEGLEKRRNDVDMSVLAAECNNIIEILCGCINDTGRTLDEYRDERLHKYMM